MALQTLYLAHVTARIPTLSLSLFVWRLMLPAAFLGFAALYAALDATTSTLGKLDALRALLIRSIPQLKADPSKLAAFADRGRIAARAGSWLFLDSDMKPDSPRFLQTWIELIARDDPAVAFGGFSLKQAPRDRRFAVHRALSGASECVRAAQRARTPEKYVYTSNLLVRRDVFAVESFDPGFTGWGWEDVEWAMRVARRFQVVHIDNPATHMGLDTVPVLVVGNKCDLENERKVTTEEGKDLAKTWNIGFFES